MGIQKYYSRHTRCNEIIGGRCELSVVGKGEGVERKATFYIRGMNPEDAVAKAYIDTTVGPNFSDFAWAIARHESRQTTDGIKKRFYNQFNTGRGMPGTPNKGNDTLDKDKNTVTNWAWGMCQIDKGKSTSTVSTAEVWNWKTNVQSMNTKLVSSRTTFITHTNRFAAAYGHQPNWTAPPSAYTIPGVPQCVPFPAEAWAVIIYYNGVDKKGDVGSVPTSNPDNSGEIQSPSGEIQSPWIFNDITGKWTFHQNKKKYATLIADAINDSSPVQE